MKKIGKILLLAKNYGEEKISIFAATRSGDDAV